jgi:DNA-binding response OmpR family regulator
MRREKILVIDDSATIRRLVDSYLSPEGYQVILAATAEDGLRLVQEVEPDLILLDHQLPGTTGSDVCRRLLELPNVRQVPIVVSSTLRKRAYVEYADLSMVVDMLPKPYTAELLKTTIVNALDTGALVVNSQQNGTAVPEVLEKLGEPELSGSFRHFRLREILDFLCNAGKSGVLEVEGQYRRSYFTLDGGRINGVTATGVDSAALAERLPPALQSLAPVLKMTVAGRRSSELDGMLELVDRKVLDPRLLRNLLRHQAALLTLDCFTQELTQFRFLCEQESGSIPARLPLESSLLALLIDAALMCDPEQIPPQDPAALYVRRAVRGQNLDRSGLSAAHMKLLSLLTEPRSLPELLRQTALSNDELNRVLYGLALADVVETQAHVRQVVIYESNATAAQQLKDALEAKCHGYVVRVFKDRLALQLVLKRAHPDVLVFGFDTEESIKLCHELCAAEREALHHTQLVAAVPTDGQPNPRERWLAKLRMNVQAMMGRPYRAEQLLQVLERLPNPVGTPAPAAPESRPAPAPWPSSATDHLRSIEADGQLCAVET